MAALLALALAALPAFQQYTLESFPEPLQRELHGRGSLWHVRRLPAGPEGKLWLVGAACGEDGCRRTLLFLQDGKTFRKVFEARGDAEEASGGDVSPPTLTLVRPLPGARVERTTLSWTGAAYRASKAAKFVVDPVTRETQRPDALDRAAEDDFVAGHDAAAAGRWAALCEAGCTPSQRAKEGRAALRAQAFPQAERALRAALEADPSLGDARLDLGDALAAQGKLGEAKAAYEAAARCRDESVQAEAKDRLARLPRPAAEHE